MLSQANPVSTTLYEVLAATKNVRIRGIAINITWGVTQPTPLEVVLTVDGQTVTYSFTNPVSATEYFPTLLPYAAENAQALSATNYHIYSPFFLEGRSVRVQARVTWATTQPTPLVCRVKYAKW